MVRTAYFDAASPRIFAHRGLHLNADGVIENSLAAFSSALAAGATHLESDVHASKDKVAVLFHDSTLERTHQVAKRISELTFTQLQEISGSSIPSLAQALEQLPQAKFNLDLKSGAAIGPTVEIIEQYSAHDRVLISSFSNRRRKKVLRKLSQPVATSASSTVALSAWISHELFLGLGFAQLVKNIDAFQVPTKMFFVEFATAEFIDRVRKHNKEIHFWTINEQSQMQRLLELGAHGIVTDRVDLFPKNAL